MVTRTAVAIVTGSAGGIGLATLRRAAELGYVAVGWDLASERPDAGAAGASGGRALDVDVRDRSAVDSAVEEIEREIGPIAVAVGAAGALDERPFGSLDDALWSATLGLHLGGTRNLVVSVAGRMMTRREGAIVAISSELAFLGAEEHVHYVAAKAAVVGFVRAAARELAGAGVRVNCVAPGPTDTPLLGPSGREPEYVRSIPLGRLGRAEDVAVAVMDVARWEWSTGQLYGVNGGAVIR